MNKTKGKFSWIKKSTGSHGTTIVENSQRDLLLKCVFDRPYQEITYLFDGVASPGKLVCVRYTDRGYNPCSCIVI